MSNGTDKYQSRENRRRVRNILLEEWDPIGVRGIEEAIDEYDRYADRAYVMLVDEAATAETISAYLYGIAAHYMDLGESAKLKQDCDRAAGIVFGLRGQFLAH